ncbi:unnamed protein product, partial [Leptidea sinapis]
ERCGKDAGSWSQFGAVQGRVQTYTEDGKLDRSEYIRVRGTRERAWSGRNNELRRSVTLVAVTPDGTGVHLQGIVHKNSIRQFLHGSIRMPDYNVRSIVSSDLVMSEFCETANEIPSTYTININTNKNSFKLVLRISKERCNVFEAKFQNQDNFVRTVNIEINGEHGTGVLELGYQNNDDIESLTITKKSAELKWRNKESITKDIGYCLALEDPAASCVDFVGGKGASLALLSSVQGKEGYHVPPGFCVTVKALQKHCQKNLQISEAIDAIKLAGVNYEQTQFKEKCTKAVELFLESKISGSLKEDIEIHLKQLRSKVKKINEIEELRFAVRSSAVGEDSEALSAAGQNDTVLGCQSDEDILKAVVKCWASMFSFTSAYYRRQNGQVCECGGAVVVQALVEPRAAGVMFTRHPDAGDPSRILITANYGLGESVVSGSVEPDTMIVKRDIHNELSVLEIKLGSKSSRIVASGTGVDEESVSEVERNTACLLDDEILKLARIGVRQDELWGAGRDIEWALTKDGVIYLLQARPITSLERWSEEELLHEFDTPIMADDELSTFANTGEVLPKPFTALTYDLIIRTLEAGIRKLTPSNGDGYDSTMLATHCRSALMSYNTVYRMVPKEIDMNVRMLEMSIHGHEIADENIFRTALHRRQPRPTDKLFATLNMIKNLIISKWVMNSTIKMVSKMHINSKTENIVELFENIASAEPMMVETATKHGITTSASTFTQFIAMVVLLEGKSGFSPEQCNEISTLLNSGDVLSAEVPQALAKLSQMLHDSGKVDEFSCQDSRSAMNWLQTNLPRVHKEVLHFLSQHGHRAIMEFDLSTKPWCLVPEELMKVLKHVKPTNEGHKKARTKHEVIASLKTPQKPNTRRALRWILPLCQKTVREREATKAQYILAIHKLRLAAIELGHLMVKEWYLPRYDLIFYFRVNELKHYIQTRDPAALKKAIQRQQYYGSWCKLKFAEMNKGWVEPLKPPEPRLFADDVQLTATSVCGGEVVARACVVRDLSEIDQLRQGDVLITHSTDIGWSPYFPLLSGIVTELGGLISHGAVIAREYGLPCIVGAVDATNTFKSGDTVRLSGYTGVVQRVTIVNNDL